MSLRSSSGRVSANRRLPGFRLSLGLTLVWLSFVVLLPLLALMWAAGSFGWDDLWRLVSGRREQAALMLTFSCALAAAVINTVAGLLVAWVLTRYRFPGRALLDALIDLPFALPTAVAGLTLTALFAGNGWLGRYLEPVFGKIAYAPPGIVLALVFVTLPFVVRTVQPVLADIEPELEEAARSLGATPAQIFCRVLFPTLVPALMTGFVLSLARALGEYGSLVFIAGNIPMVSEILPLLIVARLEQFDIPGATALALVMLSLSFALLLLLNAVQGYFSRHPSWGGARP